MFAAAEGNLGIGARLGEVIHSQNQAGAGQPNTSQEQALLNAQDNAGWTALHHAASRGHSQAVLLLLTAGAQVDLPNHFGWTPLMISVENTHLITLPPLLNQ